MSEKTVGTEPIELLYDPAGSMRRVLTELPDHPPTEQCPDLECLICGYRDCPFHEPLHYHHDGCPSRCEDKMITVTKRFAFEASHVLPGHPGKCKQLHGHSYKLEVTVSGTLLEGEPYFIDFGELGTIVDHCILSRFDHRHLNDEYPFAAMAVDPSAERLALFICGELQERLHTGIHVERIRLYETEDCYVEVTRGSTP